MKRLTPKQARERYEREVADAKNLTDDKQELEYHRDDWDRALREYEDRVASIPELIKQARRRLKSRIPDKPCNPVYAQAMASLKNAYASVLEAHTDEECSFYDALRKRGTKRCGGRVK